MANIRTLTNPNTQYPYNSRIIGAYLKYLGMHFPELDIYELLKYLGM